MSEETKERLSSMYEGLCNAIAAKLKDPEKITAADIQAIRGFFKDNGITALPVQGSPLGNAVKAAEDCIKFPFGIGSVLPEDDPVVQRKAEPN